MSFLQPMLLAALPLVALPIIIHLINQRRYQTVRWAAMMFLLAANRMSRGYARLRQWLIMAFRMLAIAGADLRRQPAAGRRLARPGRRAAGPIRRSSCSTARRACSRPGPGGGGSKLETGPAPARRGRSTTLGSARWVLIESATNTARELESADALLQLRRRRARRAPRPTSRRCSQAARDYIRANKAGRTEIWICSDLRAERLERRQRPLAGAAGRVPRVPAGRPVPPARLSPDGAAATSSVRVTDVRRQKAGDGAELLVSLRLTREGAATARESVPVQFEIDGARSEVDGRDGRARRPS